MTTQTKSRNIVVGAIGAGQIVREQHFPILAAIPQVRLAWVADIDRKSTVALADVYGCAALDPGVLTEDRLGGIDVLLVAVPFGARTPYYDRLQAGFSNVSLFIEKPLARTLLEHQRIVSLRPAHQVACDYFRRASPAVRFMKRMIAEGFWGKLKECRFGVGGLGGYSVGDKYYADAAMSGGGLLMEIGVHCLDAILFCADAVPVGKVTGRMIMENGIDLHTRASTMLQLRDGANVPFAFVVTILEETKGCLEFVFEQHTVSFSLFDDRGIEVRKTQGRSGYRITDDALILSGRQTLASFWMRFFESLATGIVNETSAASSIGVTRLVEAGYTLAGYSIVLEPEVNGPTEVSP